MLNPAILDTDVQQFIHTHQDVSASDIALHKSTFPGVSAAELASQIDGKQRCRKKLPLWYQTRNIYFPPKLNLEQASSEATAQYKSRLAIGDTLIDLTGGFGVDSYYFSTKLREVTYVEQSKELCEIARHNLTLLGVKNVRFLTGDSIRFLEDSTAGFDTIYVDPARRTADRKVFMLHDTLPDVISNLPLLINRGRRIIIKTSPLLDVRAGLSDLRHVSQIHVLSVRNDCKELLWIIDRHYTGSPQIFCTLINAHIELRFTFGYEDEQNAAIPPFAYPQNYLYEPDVALLKAGCFKLTAHRFHLAKLHPNSHLYTSSELHSDFPGRIFKVDHSLSYGVFSKDRNKRKANVIVRNFPTGAPQLQKKHRITDGSDNFLLFTTGPAGDLLVIEARKLTPGQI